MNEFAIELPALLTASVTLSVSAAIAWLALAWIKPAGHKIYRLVWFAVLINGIMLARVSIDLPILDPESSTSMAGLFGEPITDSVALPEVNDSAEMVESNLQLVTSSEPIPEIENREEMAASVATNDSAAPTQRQSFNLFGLLGWLWMLGFVVAIGFLAINYIRFLILVSSAKAATATWSKQCNQLCQESGLRRPLKLLVHEQLGPALMLTPCGYRIVVPQQLWSEMTSGQRSAVLRHEIEHYRRGDILTSLFAFVVAAIHWFNPFAWIAVCKLNLAAEWACDSAAVSNQTEQSNFARALLSISTSNSNYLVGAHGIGSSDLKLRIQRILGKTNNNSRWGGAALTSLAMIIVLSGWINLRLITETSMAAVSVAATVVDEAELEANVKELVNQLSTEGELNKKFLELTKTPSGMIAIGNSVAGVENDMREEASRQLVPEFFETEVDDKFRMQMSREIAEARTDIENLNNALTEIREQHVGETDADKLFRRFIKADNAAMVLYFAELRKQMRPGQQVLMQHLGRFLAKRNDGKYIVRESAKAPLIEKLKRFESADEQAEFLRSELNLLADELMEQDELHKKLKKRLRSNRGVGFVLAMAFDGDDGLNDRVTKYLQDLEYYFEDAPDGLIINEEAREQLINGMAQMEQYVAKLEMLRKPILEIVKDIDDQNGEAEKVVKSFLQSEAGLATLSMRIDVDATGTDGIAERIKSQILQETDAGLVVREDHHEEIAEFSRNMLRANRNLRRQLRIVDDRTDKIPKNKIGNLLDSAESKLILVEKVQQYMQQRSFDAWPTWLEGHFELVDGKYHVRDEAQEMVDYLTQESKEIQQELANDDF